METCKTAARPLIVLVDDAASARAFFERAMASLPVDVMSFVSAAEAMTVLAARQPALLFLDIIMPEKDGLTFLQELRASALHQDTAIVILSSKDYAQDRQAAANNGVAAYLPKPVSSETLRQTVTTYVRMAPEGSA